MKSQGTCHSVTMDRRTFLGRSMALTASLSGGLMAFHSCNAGSAAADATAMSSSHQEPSPIAEVVRDEKRPYAAVIGAGVSGLAAARDLALKGWRVDVLEKDPNIGGYCSTLNIDGFTFDLGPHVFPRIIRKLVEFKPGDLLAAGFSESFLMGGKLLNFPLDLISPAYLGDMLYTLAQNTIDPSRFATTDIERFAAVCYGHRAASEIFKPLIEKWCSSPLALLDHRYIASRMHSKLAVGAVWTRLNKILDASVNSLTGSSGGSRGNTITAGDGFPNSPGYSGAMGARIIPDRLVTAKTLVRVYTDTPVQRIGVEKGRISSITAGNQELKPDFVISTIPLNRLGAMTDGAPQLEPLMKLDYINVVFIFVRIRRPGLLKTEWSWIPEPNLPFYRMSEMSIFSKAHAPENSTGMCLEASVKPLDKKWNAP
ncbi:MAG: FAD-dependent oxidoreductase, partial [Pseudomonadota bacterium]